MKHLLLTTIAAVLVVGCGPSVSINEAARDGNIEAVKQHLDTGTDVNAKGELGETPLHFSAQNGHKEIVEMLIAKDADVNAKEENGETPLDWAIFGYNVVEGEAKAAQKEIADLLRKHGAKTGEELKAEGN